MHCPSVRIASFIVGALCCCAYTGLAQENQERSKSQQSQPRKKAPDSAKRQASLSGCIDQQDGKYVLIHPQTLDLVAQLEADGFDTEGFAKHVGHKVTVRGTSNSSGTERPVFKVRSIEALSDACGQQELSL